jgi:hypothetical protein
MYIIRNEGQKEVSMATVKISSGNSKMGSVPSVSLPSIKTCRQCACQSKCYAQKLERLRPAVRNAYQHNLEVLINEPETYWREVEASVMMSRFFRFHVSGDIPTAEYLANMVAVAGRNSHCEILCFTKRYEMVNEFIEQNGELPSNLHMIFSGWIGLDMVNPFSLPEAHVRYRDGFTTACANAVECGGNCTECALTEGGCWNLQKGQQVVFNEH